MGLQTWPQGTACHSESVVSEWTWLLWWWQVRGWCSLLSKFFNFLLIWWPILCFTEAAVSAKAGNGRVSEAVERCSSGQEESWDETAAGQQCAGAAEGHRCWEGGKDQEPRARRLPAADSSGMQVTCWWSRALVSHYEPLFLDFGTI